MAGRRDAGRGTESGWTIFVPLCVTQTRFRDELAEGRHAITVANSHYSCAVSASSRRDSAWSSEADFRRLLPVCCPG
jgi:hypothetical protein